MYCTFYHLEEPPFQQGTEGTVLWEGRNYRKSFEALKYGLTRHTGLSLLTGDAGSGKTTVIRALLSSLDQAVQHALISDSSLTVAEFYALVAHGFSLPDTIDNREALHEHLARLLKTARKDNRKLLLVVDEAQHLSRELLQEIDALLELQSGETRRLNICLVGQLNNIQGVEKRIDRVFANHVMVRYFLAPCTVEESGEYVKYRLREAGGQGGIFTQDALTAVHQHSGGLPGRINIICDLALFDGFNAKSPEITAAIVHASAEKLEFPELQEQDAAGYVSDVSFETKSESEVSVVDPAARQESSPGRFYFLPVLAVLAGLIVFGGGYAYYTRPPRIVLSLDPAAVERPSDQGKSALLNSIDRPAQHEKLFDAVGYSPPREEYSLGSNPSVEHINQEVDVPSSSPVDVPVDPVVKVERENSIEALPVVPEAVEVNELRVEESLVLEPVASVQTTTAPLLEDKDAAVEVAAASTPDGLDEATEVVAASIEKDIPPIPVPDERGELNQEPVEGETPDLAGVEHVQSIEPGTVAVGTPADLPTTTSGNIENLAGTSLSPVGGVLSTSENTHLDTEAGSGSVPTTEHTQEEVSSQDNHQMEAVAVGTGLENSKQVNRTDDEHESGEISGIRQERSTELEGFFKEGAFSGEVSTPLPENTGPGMKPGSRPIHTQVAAAAVSEKKSTVNPQNIAERQVPQEPQPEDVIDWLLKRKETDAP